MEISKIYNLYNQFYQVTTDSRNVPAGSLYFGLRGDKFDGNKFASQAIADGAAYAIIDNPEFVTGEKTILVSNVLETLQELANHHRRQLQIPVIGITGTNGKTTTKELINAVLTSKYKVLATKGNLNNHIGVPLTLLSIKPGTEMAIIEMGANHPGEIKFLSEIALPDVGLITNVGKAHLEGFGGFEGVKKTKKELYDVLAQRNGTVFLNSEDILLKELLTKATLEHGDVKIITYGNGSSNSVIRYKIVANDPFLQLEIADPVSGATHLLQSKLVGDYNTSNILSAISIGLFFQIPISDIINSIEGYQPANNRSQLLETPHNKVILDCYNANPTSTMASIKNFEKMAGESKTIILGDMLELGDEAEQEHQLILQELENMKDVRVYLVGPWYFKLKKSPSIHSFNQVAELSEWLKTNRLMDNLVLVKGSRGIQLEKVLDQL